MQVHCIGGQRGARHHSVLGLCSWVFSSLPCFCPFYRSSPNLKWSFFRNFFPLVSVFSGRGFLKQLPNRRQTLLSLATSVCYSPPNMISHCRRTLLVLEMKVYELEMNTLGDCFSHSYLPLKWELSCWGDPKVCRCTTASSVALNWYLRPSK